MQQGGGLFPRRSTSKNSSVVDDVEEDEKQDVSVGISSTPSGGSVMLAPMPG